MMQRKTEFWCLKNQLRLIHFKLLAMMVLLLVCNSYFIEARSTPSQHLPLNFKNVLETREGRDHEYEPGKDIYPRYSYAGLPEDFAIRKSPDFSLTYEDIQSVEIKKGFSPHIEVYTLTINLNKEAAERMRVFSEKYLKKRVAVEIDGKIIEIVTIIGVAGDQFILTIGRTSPSEIEREFRKVTDKIRYKDTT